MYQICIYIYILYYIYLYVCGAPRLLRPYAKRVRLQLGVTQTYCLMRVSCCSLVVMCDYLLCLFSLLLLLIVFHRGDPNIVHEQPQS